MLLQTRKWKKWRKDSAILILYRLSFPAKYKETLHHNPLTTDKFLLKGENVLTYPKQSSAVEKKNKYILKYKLKLVTGLTISGKEQKAYALKLFIRKRRESLSLSLCIQVIKNYIPLFKTIMKSEHNEMQLPYYLLDIWMRDLTSSKKLI